MTEKEVVLLAMKLGYIKKKIGVRLYNYIKYNGKRVCEVCGYEIGKHGKTDIDHKIPLVLGGTNDFDNLQVAHISCNRKKDTLILTDIIK